MYLVSSGKFPLADGKTERIEKIPIAETTTLSNGKQEKKRKCRKLPLNKKRKLQHPYDKWVRFRERDRETNIKGEALIKEFLRKLLPKVTSHHSSSSRSTDSLKLTISRSRL